MFSGDYARAEQAFAAVARILPLAEVVNNEGVAVSRQGHDGIALFRQAVAADPKLRVLIVHGWNDLSCPFMGSILTVDQMPVMGDPSRVAVREYPGGHMFYTRPSSRADLRKDVMEMYSKH